MNALKFSKKQIIWTITITVIAIIGILFFNSHKTTAPQNTFIIKRGDVIQEVSVTGRVKAASTVDLSFEKSGRIQNVYVKVGNRVLQGALIAEIESAGALASLQETEARLAELKRGSRPEEIAVKEAELAKYTQDLTNAYSGISDIIDDAFTKTDDAVHTKTSGIFSGYKNSSYSLTFSVCDSQLDTNTTQLRYATEIDIDSWRDERSAFTITASQNDLKDALAHTAQHLEKTRLFLESLNRALTLDCTITNSSLDTYRTNVNTAQTNIATAIATVNTKGQTIASSALTVAKVRDELSLLNAGTEGEVIAAQEARVLSAQDELRKHKIYSPISGTVTKVDAITGEFANTALSLLSISSDSSFEIDANVPEADIAKIKIGDTARVTLDAYGSDILFEGRVVTIDPAETIIDNVPTYKVTLHFTKDDARIKSGMTANIDIVTALQKDVLYVPSRAIVSSDSKKTLTVLNMDNTTREVVITTGIRGRGGIIEVLSGVNEGDLIIIETK